MHSKKRPSQKLCSRPLRRKNRLCWLLAGLLGVLVVLGQARQVLQPAGSETAPRFRDESEAAVRVSRVGELSAGLQAVPVEDSLRVISELLIDAVIQVESRGDAGCVGKAGERGIMQIKRDTWNQMAPTVFGRRVTFDLAFDPEMNRRVGRAYLGEIQRMLHARRAEWNADERSLLLACYNAGPNGVRDADFDLRRIPQQTRDYVARVTALHDFYLARNGVSPRDLAQAPASRTALPRS